MSSQRYGLEVIYVGDRRGVETYLYKTGRNNILKEGTITSLLETIDGCGLKVLLDGRGRLRDVKYSNVSEEKIKLINTRCEERIGTLRATQLGSVTSTLENPDTVENPSKQNLRPDAF